MIEEDVIPKMVHFRWECQTYGFQARSSPWSCHLGLLEGAETLMGVLTACPAASPDLAHEKPCNLNPAWRV